MTLSPMPRVLATLVLGFCVLCVVMTGRAVLSARSEWNRAQAALRSAEPAEAIVALRRAARWNAPGNVYADEALTALGKLASSFEVRGDLHNALAAQRAIHSAIHASSGFVRFEQDRLARADQKIVELMLREPAAEIDAAKSEDERRALYLSLLEGQRPSPFWVVFAFLGCVTWIVAASVFLLRGVDHRGRVVRAVARRSGLVLLVGWIAFALGLRLA